VLAGISGPTGSCGAGPTSRCEPVDQPQAGDQCQFRRKRGPLFRRGWEPPERPRRARRPAQLLTWNPFPRRVAPAAGSLLAGILAPSATGRRTGTDASTPPLASDEPSKCWCRAGSSSRNLPARVAFPFLMDFFQNLVVLLRPLPRESPGASAQAILPKTFRGHDSHRHFHLLAVHHSVSIHPFSRASRLAIHTRGGPHTEYVVA
jgi:hypothetical protein